MNVMLRHSRWEAERREDKKIGHSRDRAAAATKQILWRRLAQGQS